MNSHPNTLFTVSDLRRQELLRAAERERVAAMACQTRPSFAPATVWKLAAGIGAKLLSVAETLVATPRRALLVLPYEQH